MTRTQTITVGSTGSRIEVLAPASRTSGAVSVYRWRMSASTRGPSPHVHDTFAETFVVEEGSVDYLDGSTWRTLGEGDVVHAPAGGVHALRRGGAGPATVLMVLTPGIAREDYFARLATAAEHEVPALHREHDNHLVPDPASARAVRQEVSR